MKSAFVLPLSLGLLAACGNPSLGEAGRTEGAARLVTFVSVDPVVQWNRILLSIVRTPGAQPATVHPTRSFAILHAAIYDAVNAIGRTHAPYLIRLHGAPRRASQQAAAAAAAHGVLVSLYPASSAQLDAQFDQSLAGIPDGAEKTQGVLIGAEVARRILALRADDGSAAQPLTYVFGTVPGAYQSTPPNFPPQPQFPHWSRVRPFALERANQFRPRSPPSLTSDAYTGAFNEVKSLGTGAGSTATAEQSLIGRFWNGAVQNYWNEIAQTASVAAALTTAQNARLFALLNLALADSVIAFYDAKYVYNFWRPVTAVRAADVDGNPKTEADPNWLPEVGKTAPDPSYPGAHAVISAAAAAVLTHVLGTEPAAFSVTSEVMPGTERSFESFSAVAQEASSSRIFAGQHFRFDLSAGRVLGRQVADLVLDRFLTPHDEEARGEASEK